MPTAGRSCSPPECCALVACLLVVPSYIAIIVGPLPDNSAWIVDLRTEVDTLRGEVHELRSLVYQVTANHTNTGPGRGEENGTGASPVGGIHVPPGTAQDAWHSAVTHTLTSLQHALANLTAATDANRQRDTAAIHKLNTDLEALWRRVANTSATVAMGEATCAATIANMTHLHERHHRLQDVNLSRIHVETVRMQAALGACCNASGEGIVALRAQVETQGAILALQTTRLDALWDVDRPRLSEVERAVSALAAGVGAVEARLDDLPPAGWYDGVNSTLAWVRRELASVASGAQACCATCEDRHVLMAHRLAAHNASIAAEALRIGAVGDDVRVLNELVAYLMALSAGWNATTAQPGGSPPIPWLVHVQGNLSVLTARCGVLEEQVGALPALPWYETLAANVSRVRADLLALVEQDAGGHGGPGDGSCCDATRANFTSLRKVLADTNTLVAWNKGLLTKVDGTVSTHTTQIAYLQNSVAGLGREFDNLDDRVADLEEDSAHLLDGVSFFVPADEDCPPGFKEIAPPNKGKGVLWWMSNGEMAKKKAGGFDPDIYPTCDGCDSTSDEFPMCQRCTNPSGTLKLSKTKEWTGVKRCKKT